MQAQPQQQAHGRGLFPGMILAPQGPFSRRMDVRLNVSMASGLGRVARSSCGGSLTDALRLLLHVSLAAVEACSLPGFMRLCEEAIAGIGSGVGADTCRTSVGRLTAEAISAAANDLRTNAPVGPRDARAHARVTITTTRDSSPEETDPDGGQGLSETARARASNLLAAWREAAGRDLPSGASLERALRTAHERIEEHGLEDATAGLRYAVEHPASGSTSLAGAWFRQSDRFAGWVERGTQLERAASGCSRPEDLRAVALVYASAGVRHQRRDVSMRRRWSDLRDDGLAAIAAELDAGAPIEAFTGPLTEDPEAWSRGWRWLVEQARAPRERKQAEERRVEAERAEAERARAEAAEREAFLAAVDPAEMARAEAAVRARMSGSRFAKRFALPESMAEGYVRAEAYRLLRQERAQAEARAAVAGRVEKPQGAVRLGALFGAVA